MKFTGRTHKHTFLALAAVAMLPLAGCEDNAKAPGSANQPETVNSQVAETSTTQALKSAALTLEHKAVPLSDEIRAKVPFADADVATSITIGKTGGTMLFATFGDGPKDFNPITANDSGSGEVNGLMYSPLINLNLDTQDYIPGLLKEWVMSETDKRDWKLTLRDGLKWSDGVPLNADDVMFSLQTIYNPKVPNASKDILQVEGKPFVMTKVDDQTLSVTIAQPSASMPALLGALTVLPKHKLESTVEAGTFDQVLNTNADPANIVCNGPFKIKQYETGQRVILERNPHYYRFDVNGTRLPYLDTLIISYSPDQDQQLLRFKAGQADAFIRPRAANIPDLMDDQQKGNFTVYDCGAGDGANVFWFNLKQGTNTESGKPYVPESVAKLIGNAKFRQSCLYAIDKDSIIATELRGLSASVWSLVSPALAYWHNPNVPKYEFDTEKAKAILEEIGLTDWDNDGIREMADGTKASFTFITNKGNKARENIATLISADLKNVGIDARPQFIDFNTLVTKTADSFDYEACLLGFGGAIHPANSMNLYLSTGRTHFWNPGQTTPATPWEAKVDKLCKTFNTTLDTAEQQRDFNEVQQIIAEECPFLPLFTSKVYVVVRNKFGNLRPSPFSHELLWNADEIYEK